MVTTKRNVTILSLMLVSSLVLVGLPTGSSQDDGAAGAGTASAGAGALDGGGQSLDLRSEVLTLGGYEAKGVGLRNLGTSTISLTEVPADAIVLEAHLYWEIMAHGEESVFAEATFAGEPIVGDNIGSGRGLCWSASQTYSYHADVTDLVAGAGDYEVAIESGLTGGQDPFGWLTPQVLPLAEGASLVVIYLSPTQGIPMTVQLMDGFVNADYVGTTPVEFPATTVPGLGLLGVPTLTVLGGDGQTNAGEAMDFNGAEFARNTFDGSDPMDIPDYPFGNLWDTDTFDMTGLMNVGGSNELVVDGFSDCLGISAAVLATPIV